MNENPNFFAIIPANVRYSDITPNAKLLYGEITALCSKNGVCYATNDYFAQLYKVSKVSISKWIKELSDHGFIETSLEYKEGTKQILNRYIRIVYDPIKEKLNTPIKEKFKENNTSNINTDDYLKKENSKKEKENLDDSFAEFWLAYLPVKCDGRFVNKGSKKEAYKRYKKAVRGGAKPEDILTGLKKYLAYCIKNNQLTCQACVFLSKMRWQDDFDTKTITSAKSVKLGCNDEGIPY